jgi:hypothetical protein
MMQSFKKIPGFKNEDEEKRLLINNSSTEYTDWGKSKLFAKSVIRGLTDSTNNRIFSTAELKRILKKSRH